MATRAFRPQLAALVEQREARRYRVGLELADVASGADRRRDAVLIEVSTFGCRIELGDAPPIGAAVTIALAGGTTIAARIVWSDTTLIGCRFDRPIPRAVMRALTLGLYPAGETL